MGSCWNGGAEGTRTPDPRLAKAVLSQLSYCPSVIPLYLWWSVRELNPLKSFVRGRRPPMQTHISKTEPRSCEVCKSTFTAPLKEVMRGNGRFCSLKCANSRARADRTPNQTCALCGRAFFKRPSAVSKSGLYFCCRSHKDAAQRLGGIKAIQPPHYGTGEGHQAYRALAFGHLPHRCIQCGYRRVPDVLHVHHKDGDRANNHLDNLELRCPTCHAEWHYLNREHKGPWRLPSAFD